MKIWEGKFVGTGGGGRCGGGGVTPVYCDGCGRRIKRKNNRRHTRELCRKCLTRGK